MCLRRKKFFYAYIHTYIHTIHTYTHMKVNEALKRESSTRIGGLFRERERDMTFELNASM